MVYFFFFLATVVPMATPPLMNSKAAHSERLLSSPVFGATFFPVVFPLVLLGVVSSSPQSAYDKFLFCIFFSNSFLPPDNLNYIITQNILCYLPFLCQVTVSLISCYIIYIRRILFLWEKGSPGCRRLGRAWLAWPDKELRLCREGDAN